MRLALRPTRRSTLVVVLCVSLVTAAVTVTGSAPAGAAHSPGSAEPFAAAPTNGIWLSQSEILALPTSGAAWNQLRSAADGSLGSANISNNESDHDVLTLAVALVYARTGDPSYRAKAADAIDDAIGTESGGNTLALSRNLLGYVLAADLIDLAGYDSAAEQRFRSWLSTVRNRSLDGRTLITTHEDRPNNWGTHAAASRIAAAIYLGDQADLDAAATVFRGWLGDRSAYSGFTYGDKSWQADPSNPVGVNPPGATIGGHDVDGVLPDDQRRGGDFEWPPPCENYVREAMQGVVVGATILERRGYPAFEWGSQALRRAGEWLVSVASCPFSGDDEFVPWLLNAAYGTGFATELPARHGKGMGWTDWTHGASSGSGLVATGSFIDDDGSFHEPAIEAIRAVGITNGCNSSGTRYCPDDPVTRAQMASFLVRALGYTKGAGSDQFTDDDGSFHEPDIERLHRAGITNGCNSSGTRYCPDDPVTRGEMATFLARALGLI